MDNIFKKNLLIEKTVLFIDDSELECSRVKKILSKDTCFIYCLIRSCNITEILNTINSKIVDVILYGLKATDPRARLITGMLCTRELPPIIVLKNRNTSSIPPGLKFSSHLNKTDLQHEIFISSLHSIFDEKKRSSVVTEGIGELQINEFRLLNSILESPDGIVISSKKGRIYFANPAACVMLYGSEIVKKFKPLEVDFSRMPIQELAVMVTRKVLDVRSTEISWNDQHVFLLSLRDITMRKQAETALRESEKRYELAVKGSKDGLWDWDLKKNICHFNIRWNEILGLNESEFFGDPQVWINRIHASDRNRFKKRLELHIDGMTELFECEYRIKHKSGSWIWVLVRGECTRERSGKPVRITGLQSEITERKKAEKQLKKSFDELRFALASEKILMDELDKKNKELIELSITDGLTGLYNHRFLQERFDFEYKRMKRYGGIISCMMIDIDHFKMINDNFGHQFGDQVLRQLSNILKANSREVDICGRYGGEEFMVVTNLNAEDTLKFASKLHAAIEQYEFINGNQKVHVTVSIGIAECKTDIHSRQELIERADSALYNAKKDGRNLIRVWKTLEHGNDLSLDMESFESMKGKFIDLSNQMRATYIESTNALVKAVDAKDPFAKEHSHNVSIYSIEIARMMQLPEQDIEVIGYAGLLHDVGKISVNEEILTKKDALTQKEFEILRRHPEVGVNILRDMKFLEKEIPIILHHHERYDGKGYPFGLKGREIPLGARIVAVADALDAMTSGRTYKKRLSWNDALKEISKGSGTQFAPDVVSAVMKIGKKGSVQLDLKKMEIAEINNSMNRSVK
jgi:diguanylate cyclase (GGDEF)-like protein/PAS domain S-box-containing protein/putative nucleotidyltransferase with HDIG domain